MQFISLKKSFPLKYFTLKSSLLWLPYNIFIIVLESINLTNYRRWHSKLFTNCHVSWDTLYLPFCSNDFIYTGIYSVLLQEVYQSLTFQQIPLIKLLHASHQKQLAIKLLPVLLLHQQTQESSKKRTGRIGEEGTEEMVSFSFIFFKFLKFYKFNENSKVCDNFSIKYKIQFENFAFRLRNSSV